MLIFCTTSALG